MDRLERPRFRKERMLMSADGEREEWAVGKVSSFMETYSTEKSVTLDSTRENNSYE